MSRSGVYRLKTDQPQGYDNTGFQTTEFKDNLPATNGVDAEDNKVSVMPDKPYRGMGKEELLYFSSQPFWRRLRMICVAIVLIGWVALVITVVALVLAYPKCRDPAARTWWQTQPVYRVYVPSFKDSDGDGVGDLKGVESKLDYIKGLGFGVVSLSPFYHGDSTSTSTSNAVFKAGDDMTIMDHKAVGTKYGNLTTFQQLVNTAHEKGMYIVVDFIPNLTSTRHPWFNISSRNTTNDLRHFFVWADSNTPPNNWLNKYTSGSAWQNDTSRGEAYLQQFGPGTADLNLRSNRVREELESILTFWLDLGVDGFHVRHTAYLYEDYDLRDDQPISGSAGSEYSDFDHTHSSNQDELYGLMEHWRILLTEHNKTSTPKLLMADIDGGVDASRLYGHCDMSGAQMPLNRHVLSFTAQSDGDDVGQYVANWMAETPSGKWANWVLGDEDTDRLSNRVNSSFSNVFAILTFLMPGTPVVYCGDEQGASNIGAAVNAWSRGQPSRAIFPWTNGDFCGNNCTAWTDVSVTQAGMTNLLSEIMALRGEQSFKVGDFAYSIRNANIFSFVREFDGESGYLVAINFGSTNTITNFYGSHDTIPDEATVVLSHGTPYDVDDDVDLSSMEIGPHGALVVSWDYVAKEL